MKIVLVGPVSPYRGGIAQTSGMLGAALVNAGHQVFALNFKKQFPKILFPGKTQFEEHPAPLPFPTERVLIPWNPLSWIRAAKAIAREKPDLILFQWWMPFFAPGYWGLTKFLPKVYRARIGYIMHNVIPHERRFGDVFLSRLALSGSRFFILLSRNEEAEMKKLFPHVPAGALHVTPLPLFNSYPKFSGPKEEAKKILGVEAAKILLFFGFVRDYKGLDILIEACPKIFEIHPDAKLMVAGEFYGGREKYQKQIADLKLQDKIIIHDRFISEAEVGVFFAAADCAVLPYRSATQSAVIAAAYALDMPVITTDVGGLKEVVVEGKTGLVVPPEDPDALANAVIKFYALGGRAAFEEHVREEAKKFRWEKFVETVEESKKIPNPKFQIPMRKT